MGLQCFWYEDELGNQVSDAHVSAIVDHRENIEEKSIDVHVAACGAEGEPRSNTQPHKRWIASIQRTKQLKKTMCSQCEKIIHNKMKPRLARAS